MSTILLTVEEAARLLSLSRTTVYKLMQSGELQAVKIGKSRRIAHDVLEKYVKALSAEETK